MGISDSSFPAAREGSGNQAFAGDLTPPPALDSCLAGVPASQWARDSCLCHTHTHTRTRTRTPLAHAHSEYYGNFKLESVLDPRYLSLPHVLEVRKASTKYKALPVLQSEFRAEAETPCFPAPHPAPSAVSAELAHIPAPHPQLDDAGLSPVSPFQSQARVWGGRDV